MPSAVTYTFVDGPGNTASGAQVTRNFRDALDGLDGLESATGIPNPQTKPKMRGASVIATTGTRTNVAYGAVSDGPDQVTGIVLPANGLIAVFFQAVWQSSVANAASAALFLGANQVTFSGSAAAPAVQAAGNSGVAAASDSLLTTFGGGLVQAASTGGYTGDVTTGQILGAGTGANVTPPTAHLSPGPAYIEAAAGTYTVSVQFKATSGSVTVKSRKLWVWAVGF